jgi:hypothetical protein
MHIEQIAQIAQVAPLSQSGLHTVIAGVILILTICGAGVGIWSQLRRKPPIEAEFQNKTDCLRNHAHIDQRLTNIEREMKLGVTSLEFGKFREGMDGVVERIRAANERDMREILDRINELHIDINSSAERRASEMYARINVIDNRVSRVEALTKKA